MPRSLKWFFSSGFITRILYALFISSMYATCLTHLILLPLITVTSTEHEAPHYVHVSILLLHPPSQFSVSLQHPVLKHPQSTECLSHTEYKTNFQTLCGEERIKF
jgi:hypothetical protein